MRDRLVEFILECSTYTPNYEPQARLHAEYLAQHLLNNGVIVPPCKVGDTVYCIFENDNDTWYISKKYVRGFLIDDTGIKIRSGFCTYRPDEIGKELFFTLEEAGKALKERSE